MAFALDWQEPQQRNLTSLGGGLEQERHVEDADMAPLRMVVSNVSGMNVGWGVKGEEEEEN